MIVSIHQPQYLPWLGFFNKWQCADLFVILDHVQYQKNGLQNRTQIKSPPSWVWLTVPVSYNYPSPIYKVKISFSIGWQEKHKQLIYQNYKQAPYFNKFSKYFDIIFKQKWKQLIDLQVETMKIVANLLSIDTPVIRSTDLSLKKTKTDLLIEICQKVGADQYLSGMGGKKYMDEDKISQSGIKVVYQNYQHPIYNQQYPQINFQPYMSIIDLLFNYGESSKKILA